MNAFDWKTLFSRGSEREEMIRTESGNVWTSRTGSGSGVPLIVIHGGPGFPHDYLLPLKELGAGRPVIFYDQLGCGRSPGAPRDGVWQWSSFVEELERVAARWAPDGAHLLGHSWGAVVAAEAALRGFPAVSLILASPFLSAERWISDAAVRIASLPAEIRTVLQAGAETAAPVDYARATEEYYRRFVHGGHGYEHLTRAAAEKAGTAVYQALWGPNEFVVQGALKEYEIGTRLGEIRVPVLYTAGRNDEVLPETLEQFAAETPDARTRIFELSAHHPHLSETREYCSAIRSFLESVEKK